MLLLNIRMWSSSFSCSVWYKSHLRCLKLSGTLGPKRSIKFFARQLAVLSAYSQIFEDAIAWLNISANSRRSWQEAALLLREFDIPLLEKWWKPATPVLSLHHLFSPRNNLLSPWCSSFFFFFLMWIFLIWIAESRGLWQEGENISSLSVLSTWIPSVFPFASF